VDDQVLNFRRLINKQLKFKDGDLILHTTPGLGFGFDEAAVKKYAIGKSTWYQNQISPARAKQYVQEVFAKLGMHS